jgi:hypothetical protein
MSPTTIGDLWLPVLGGPGSVAPFLRNHTTDASASFSSSVSVTFSSSYSTSAGDCIVIAYAGSGTNTPSFSGCGATWTTYNAGAAGPTIGLAVGYNCTGGGTSITMTNWNAVDGGITIAIFGGIATVTPVTAHQSAYASGGVTSETTPSLSYTVGELIVMGYGQGASSAVTPSFSAGSVTVLTGSGGNRADGLAYWLSTTGSSGTANVTIGATQSLGVTVAALNP